jgi:hypothetical protein
MEPIYRQPVFAVQSKSAAILKYFYVIMGVLSLSFVAIGFSITYFIPLAQGTFSKPLLFHAHGIMYFAWILLVISQPLLIRFRNVPLHRKIGVAGFILAAGMLFIGVAMSIVSGRMVVAEGRAEEARAFLFIPLTDMIFFGTFIGIAVMNIKNSELHKRLILLATLAVLPAAFGRLFPLAGIDPGTPLGFTVAIALQESLLIFGIAYDMATRRKIHPVYLWGGIPMVIIHIVRFPVGQTDFWKSIAERLIG